MIVRMRLPKDLIRISCTRGFEIRRCKYIFVGNLRNLSTTIIASGSKKDPVAHEKMSVCDYGAPQTTRKRFYVFGSTMEGALGIASHLRPKRMQRLYEFIDHPVRNAFGGFREVLDLEAGHGFTLFMVKGAQNRSEEMVYGTGLNMQSQLGYHAVRTGAPLGVIIRPIPLTSLPRVKEKVLAIGCGRAHSLVSFEGGGMISFGDNTSGQCGRFPIPQEEYFGSRFVHQIPSFGSTPDEDVVSIVSKFDITFCLTRSGKVFSFGNNTQGQLGRGPRILKYWEPEVVEGDLKNEPVKMLATSGNSVLAVTECGQLFAWGSNESGEVNFEDPGRIYYEPRAVPLRSKIGKVVYASLGDQFAHIVTEKGEVYTWGLGEALGLGPRVVRVQKPILMPPPLFGNNDLSPGVKVTKVFAGFFHAAAINSKGDVYTWGRNESGCLGLALKKGDEQYFPLRVSLTGFAEKVAIGVDHTVVLCRGGV